uniref:Uncharacterized protein n=1 Tax=Rousettus aegyptiacus TaxID=9407 RepID=A0A7J8BEK9_ROUAE|nr:hypothetical protein HJG63_009810 [Rousettus aegyptiacus]
MWVFFLPLVLSLGGMTAHIPCLFRRLLFCTPFLGFRISLILLRLLHLHACTCPGACGADLRPPPRAVGACHPASSAVLLFWHLSCSSSAVPRTKDVLTQLLLAEPSEWNFRLHVEGCQSCTSRFPYL